MSIINCFNCAVVNIPQKSSSRMPHKSCKTEASCETGYNNSLIFTLPMRYAIFVNESQSLKLYFQVGIDNFLQTMTFYILVSNIKCAYTFNYRSEHSV